MIAECCLLRCKTQEHKGNYNSLILTDFKHSFLSCLSVVEWAPGFNSFSYINVLFQICSKSSFILSISLTKPLSLLSYYYFYFTCPFIILVFTLFSFLLFSSCFFPWLILLYYLKVKTLARSAKQNPKSESLKWNHICNVREVKAGIWFFINT